MMVDIQDQADESRVHLSKQRIIEDRARQSIESLGEVQRQRKSAADGLGFMALPS